ncbi:hypothetical protein JCM9279_002474 [Rhodotorula babjevae]
MLRLCALVLVLAPLFLIACALPLAPLAAPYRAYPLASLDSPSPAAPAPTQPASPSTLPAALRQDAAGALVFDPQAFFKSEDEGEVCVREVFGSAVSLSFDLLASLSLKDAAGTPFRLSSGRKTTLNATRAVYLEACYELGIWAALGRSASGQGGEGGGGWSVRAGTVGSTSGSVATNQTVDQASGLGTHELAALARPSLSTDAFDLANSTT